MDKRSGVKTAGFGVGLFGVGLGALGLIGFGTVALLMVIGTVATGGALAIGLVGGTLGLGVIGGVIFGIGVTIWAIGKLMKKSKQRATIAPEGAGFDIDKFHSNSNDPITGLTYSGLKNALGGVLPKLVSDQLTIKQIEDNRQSAAKTKEESDVLEDETDEDVKKELAQDNSIQFDL